MAQKSAWRARSLLKIVAVASPLVACSAGDFGAGTVGGVGSTATTIAGSAAGVISTPVTGAKDFAVGGAIDGVRQGLDLGESGYHKWLEVVKTGGSWIWNTTINVLGGGIGGLVFGAWRGAVDSAEDANKAINHSIDTITGGDPKKDKR